MVKIYNNEERELIRESALLVSKTHGEISKMIEPGVSLFEIDRKAESFIRDHGAKPAFKGYNGFPNTLCVSLNEGVVHGIPSETTLKDGDIISVDCGVEMNGFFGDSAYTYPVGNVAEETMDLLRITLESLERAVNVAKDGNRVGDIGSTVQQFCEKHGYGVVRELVGHGVGRKLHEKPEVPNFGKAGRGAKLRTGMVIAIEPMINLGTEKVRQLKDGWTIITADGKPSAHFEHTVSIGQDGGEKLSTFDFIDEKVKIEWLSKLA